MTSHLTFCPIKGIVLAVNVSETSVAPTLTVGIAIFCTIHRVTSFPVLSHKDQVIVY
jgi:hypothetical protein